MADEQNQEQHGQQGGQGGGGGNGGGKKKKKLYVLSRIYCPKRQEENPNGSPWIQRGEIITKCAEEAAYLIKMRFCRPATKADIEEAKENATLDPKARETRG